MHQQFPVQQAYVSPRLCADKTTATWQHSVITQERGKVAPGIWEAPFEMFHELMPGAICLQISHQRKQGPSEIERTQPCRAPPKLRSSQRNFVFASKDNEKLTILNLLLENRAFVPFPTDSTRLHKGAQKHVLWEVGLKKA